MRVHDVCGATRSEESADTRRVDPVKGDDIGGRLDQAGEAHVSGRRPDNLSERRRRDRDAGPVSRARASTRGAATRSRTSSSLRPTTWSRRGEAAGKSSYVSHLVTQASIA